MRAHHARPPDVSLRTPSESPAVDTHDIMRIALELAGQSEIPADSGIVLPAREVRRAWFGIDVESGDLVAAKAAGYDLVIVHHPVGPAALTFPKVLEKHAAILERAGVPSEAAAAAVRELREDHEISAHAANFDRLPSTARLIGMPLMCIHNPCDEIGRRTMDEAIRHRVGPASTVADAIDALALLPEFRDAPTKVVVRMGSASNRLGRWVVVHGAGTNGGFPVASAAFRHGIDTVFYIHVHPGDLRRLREEFGASGTYTLVVTGHLASDSIGINAVVRELRARGIRVDCYSGIIESSR